MEKDGKVVIVTEKERKSCFSLKNMITTTNAGQYTQQLLKPLMADNICALISGFNLWTSAHGFIHISLTQLKQWRIFWIILLTVLTVLLVSCVIGHFYVVFTFGVHSRVTLESSAKMFWPTIIICDRQVFKQISMVF